MHHGSESAPLRESVAASSVSAGQLNRIRSTAGWGICTTLSLCGPMGADGGPDGGDYSKMSFAGLFFMGFFWVCGGPYGGEGLLQLAPAGVVFSVYLATIFAYAVPVSLINAELAVAIPEDGGMVVWVQRAFGDIVGGHNAWWCYVSYCFDAAVYPLLAATYIVIAVDVGSEHEHHRLLELVIAESIVVFVTLFKLLGNRALVKFIEVATVISLAPIVLLMVWGFATVRPLNADRWLRFSSVQPASSFSGEFSSSGSGDGGTESIATQWKLLISWTIWLNSGYLGIGSLAAGVANPTRSFPLLVMTLCPFIFAVNTAPFLISLCVDGDAANYESGHFSRIAEQVAGVWLRHCMLLGAVVCTVALYANCIIIPEVSMQFFLESTGITPSEDAAAGEQPAEKDAVVVVGAARTAPMSIGWLWRHDDGEVAPIYVLFNGGVAALLVLMPYRVLIEFAITTVALPTLLFLASFVVLRVQNPHLQERFRAVPCGTSQSGNILACCLAMVPAALTVLQAWLSLSDQGVDDGATHGGEARDSNLLTIGGWVVPFPALFAQVLVFALGGLAQFIGWCMLPPSTPIGDHTNLTTSLLGAKAGPDSTVATSRFGSLQGRIRGGLGYLRSYLPSGGSGTAVDGGRGECTFSEDEEELPD